jgi:hypothetical protein
MVHLSFKVGSIRAGRWTGEEQRRRPNRLAVRLQPRRPSRCFGFYRFSPLAVSFTTPRIIFRTSAGSVGQAAISSLNSGDSTAPGDKPGDKEFSADS